MKISLWTVSNTTLSAHTRLVNYVIGLCNKNIDWPCTLHEHGYKVQLMEKSIRTTSGWTVVPDVIAASNKTLHAILFECKGGNSVRADQVTRYKDVSNRNFSNWLDVYDRDHLTFDICFADTDDNHAAIESMIDSFPSLTFGQSIVKHGDFKIKALNKAMENPIPIDGCRPPLSYYPFSENDDRCEIIPHVLRTLVSIAIEKGKEELDVMSDMLLEDEEVLKRIHKMWYALSSQHKEILKKKVSEILSILKSQYKDSLGKQLKELQDRKGYRIYATLGAFKKTCDEIINDCAKQQKESQTLLTEHT